MREIKFRAWDINHKKWYSRVQVGTNCGHAVYDEEREMWLEFDEFCGVVMQWTGLVDRSGKEIYEGDIVQSTLTSRQIGKVIFEDGIYKVLWSKNNPFNDEYDSFLHNVIRSSEVIGNIYENSELINS